ncbi:MAG: hypothetical protein V1656_00195 [Candidatus Jorgensenbacteria bacterium]
MAKQKSLLVQHAGQLETVFTYLSDGWRKRGIGIIELIDKAAQPKGKPALDEIIGVGERLMNGDGKFKLSHLVLVEPSISIITPKFYKSAFFGSRMGVIISMGNQFENRVFSEMSDEVPASQGLVLASLDLSIKMKDAEIRVEIGEGNFLTPDQWAQTLFLNLTRQPNGENGHFKTDGPHFNLSYLKLRSGEIVAASACWGPVDHAWILNAGRLDDGPWGVGGRVFPAAGPSFGS